PLGAPLSNPLPTEHVNFTPPFPSYTSGHATFGGAAFKTMADFYQTDDVNFSIPFTFISDEFNGVTTDIHESIPPIILNFIRQIEPRHFVSFSQAAAENAASRIFLGVHWRFDAIQGINAGDRIADIDFDALLRPLHGNHPTHVQTVDFASQIDAYLNNTYETFFTTEPGRGRGIISAIAPRADATTSVAANSAGGMNSEKRDNTTHSEAVVPSTYVITLPVSYTVRASKPARLQGLPEANEWFSSL